MYRAFCNNLCCLFIAVILGGMTAGTVHFPQKSEKGILFSAGVPEAASMVLSGLGNKDSVRSFIPSSDGSMETYSVNGPAQAPGQMSEKCQSHAFHCSCTQFLAKPAKYQEPCFLCRLDISSRLADYYIFTLGHIRS